MRAMLHLTKVAFGCTGLDDLAQRLEARGPDLVRLNTKNRPRRADACVGGSLFWIHRHVLIGRSEIMGFDDAEGGRTDILVRPHVVPVIARRLRAHQGWRYLEHHDAPADLGAGDGAAELPPALVGELAALGLI
jgi:hypothetical protein